MVKSDSTGHAVLFRHTQLLWAFFLLILTSQILLGGGPSSAKSIRSPVASGASSTVVTRDRFAAVEFESGMASATGILVKLKHPNRRPATVSAMLKQQNLQVGRTFKSMPGLQQISIKAGPQGQSFSRDELLATIKALEASGLYEYVEPDWTVHLLQTPSDTAFTNGTLWGLQNTGQSGGAVGVDVNAVAAWGVTTGAPNVIVGVVDTGVRYSHQDLIGNMWVNPGEIPGNSIDDDDNGYVDDIYGINAITGSGDPMDDHDHGTHVAGTIAATANDSGQHVGLAFGTKIMALKFIAASGTGDTSDAIACIDYAIEQGVDILNNSWGGGGFSQALLDAIESANDAGILFVAAAGNSALDNDATPHYPSNYEVANIVAVAAIDRNGLLASFSNYGASSVDLGAPGVAIFSCAASSDTSYASFDGTSMASPHVAGVAALLASQYPAAGVAELKDRLLITTSSLASLAGRVVTGGMVDAHAALLLAEDGDLELRAASDAPLREGVASDFYITLTDLVPVTGATMTGGLDGGASLPFVDDGVSPDLIAGDGVYSATLLVPSGVSSTYLNVQVSAAGKNTASETFTFAVLMPPANDDFSDRIAVVPGTILTTGSNQAATQQSGEPINPDEAGGKTVWWEWTAAASESVTITTLGSSYDTTLAIYSGDTLAGLSLVGSNDDESLSVLHSSVTFNAIAGVLYEVQVDGYAGAEGAIQLNYPSPGGAEGPPVIVTQPVGRTVVVGDPFTLSILVVGADSLTYQWSINESPITGAQSASYTVSSVVEADEGNYTVLVTNDEGSATSDPAFVAVDLVGVLPVNDDFASALTLTGVEGQLNGTNVRATGESGEPNHAGSRSPLASVWYRWTAPEDGTFEVTTFGSDFDTTLAVYTGAAVDALTEIASNDDFIISQSYVVFEATAGSTYSIAVDGFATAEGQIVLTHAFTLPPPPPPPTANDDFDNAIDLGAGSTSTSGSNSGATGEVGEPNHAGGSTPVSSVWWVWAPPVSGSVTISTVGSDFDTTLAVYTGDSVADLTGIASNDDIDDVWFSNLQSEVTFSVSSETTYYLAVAGAYGVEGNIALSVTYTPDAVPEIKVEHSGLSVVDGISTIDFGSVAIGASAERTLTVHNIGTGPLSGLSISIVGSHAADYSATSLPASLAAGNSADFSVTLTPLAEGARVASLQIASNDSDENPFDLALTGVAGTAMELYLAEAAAAGLDVGGADVGSEPYGDGVANLLKFAFNMNLGGADSSQLLPGGTAGLPHFELISSEPSSVWRFEYLRRKGSGLIYTPMHSTQLSAGSFSPIVGTETTTDIDETWERVVLSVPINLVTDPSGFGTIKVSLP